MHLPAQPLVEPAGAKIKHKRHENNNFNSHALPVFGMPAWAENRKIAILVGAGKYNVDSRIYLPPLFGDEDSERLAKALRSKGWEVVLVNGTEAHSRRITGVVRFTKRLHREVWHSVFRLEIFWRENN